MCILVINEVVGNFCFRWMWDRLCFGGRIVWCMIFEYLLIRKSSVDSEFGSSNEAETSQK